MRDSARAVIIEDNKLLVMFRRKIKDGKVNEYYVIPGGGIEENETPKMAVLRELKEELSVDIEVMEYLGENERENGKDIYFSCKILSGYPTLGGEELDRMTKENYYEPMYIDLSKLDEYNISAKDIIRSAR